MESLNARESALEAEIRALRTRITELEKLNESAGEHARAQLLRTERALSDLVERAPFGIYVVDSEFRILQMNAGSESGAFRNVRPVIGRDLSEAMRIIWPEPVATEVIGRFRHTLETGEPFHSSQFAQPRLDVNAVESYEWELHRIELPDGKFGVICYYFDSTRLRAAENAARQSEERLRRILEGSPMGAALGDEHGHVLYANNAFLRLIGYTRDDLEAGRVRWDRITPPEYRARDLQAIAQTKATGVSALYEKEYTRTDGARVPILLACADAGSGNLAAFVLDITARKQVEDALRASEERYRGLFETMMEGVCVIEVIFDDRDRPVDYRFLDVNPAFGAQTGLNDARGRLMRDLVPEHEEYWFDIYGEVARTGKPAHFVNEARGLNRWYEVSAYRMGEAGSDTVAILFNDITDQRRSEERLRQSQRLESVGVLAGGVAHDFNNLLVGVLGAASLAEDLLPPDHPAHEYLRTITRTAEQLAHLTRQMLAYAGKGQFLLEPSDLSELVRENADFLRSSISKKIALHFELDDGLPAIEIDRGQAQQIVMNLAINAAEAIGSKEGLISIRTSRQLVDERYQREHPDAADLPLGDYAALEVRDNGSGMDETVRRRIFDPFFSTKFTGRGLGLAAVCGIVRGHKGAIFVSTEVGKGSAFTVLFPAVAARAERKGAPTRTGAARAAGVVVVIDDEAVVRQTAKGALERRGYTVLLAPDGRAAIDLFKRHAGPIDVAVLDLSMPEMSGEETLPELRRIRPEVKVLLSSGYSEREVMRMFEGQQVSGFLQKPFTAGALAEAVRRVLE